MASVNLDKMPDFMALITKGCNQGLTAAADALAQKMAEGMRKGAPRTSSPPGTPPNRQRGGAGLAGSIHGTEGVNLKASAGSGVAYARIQETGGVITARRSKFLPIPINAAAQRLLDKSGGVNGAGGLRASGVALQVIQRKGQAPLLIGKQGPRRAVGIQRGGGSLSGVPVFVLKRSITLPARPWAMPALNRNKQHILNQFVLGAGNAIRAGVRASIS